MTNPRQRQVDADLALIKRRIGEGQLPTDPKAIADALERVQRWMDSLRPDGSWPDVDYADQTPGPWKLTTHLDRLWGMAIMFNTEAGKLYRDPILRGRVFAALDFWLVKDFRNPNWWHNEIGVPRTIGFVLIQMEPELNADQLARGIAILGRATLRPATGANLVWLATNVLMRGCLANDAETAVPAINAIFNEVKQVGVAEEGIQADWSFHQHDAVIYSGGYGLAFSTDVGGFVIWTEGTRFAISPERFALLAGTILDGQQWMLRGIVFDYGVVGREITRAGKDARWLTATIQRLAALQRPRQAEFAAMAARMVGKPDAPPLLGNRHYWRSDYMAHQRGNFLISTRMYSTRTYNTDGLLNNEGRLTQRLADGVSLIFRSGKEYRDIFPVWDWRRIPGITSEQPPMPLEDELLHVKGPTSFVGGVSDGSYGLAAMDFRRESLGARKVWFCFDDGVACMGAAIGCESNNPVLTSVNQCLLKGEVEVAGTNCGSKITGTGEHVLKRPRWVYHDGVGYMFPAPARVVVRYGPQLGSWADIGAGPNTPVKLDVFNLWIDHGVKPSDGSYFYMVLPGTTPEQLARRGASRMVEQLSNTAALQALRHRGLGLLAAAFYQAGTLAAGAGWNISADQPCLLLAQERNGGLQLSLANPENQALTVNLELDRGLAGPGATALDANRTRITVELPGGVEAGRSVVRLFTPRLDAVPQPARRDRAG